MTWQMKIARMGMALWRSCGCMRAEHAGNRMVLKNLSGHRTRR
jgi:hypothetical protein